MAMPQSWVERTAMQNSAIRNSWWKYSSDDISTILLTDDNIFAMVISKKIKNHQLYATAATKKRDVTTKRLRTRSTFRQSLMASVGESQVVEKTQVWYLSITELKLVRAAIVTRCCCNSYRPPYVRSQMSIFQQDSARRTWRLRQSTCLPITSSDI